MQAVVARIPAVLVALLIGLVTACAAGPTRSAVSEVPALADSLTETIAVGDRVGFLENFQGTSHAQLVGGVWFDNLAGFHDVAFASPHAQQAANSVNVTWRVPGDSVTSRATFGVELSQDPERTVITGLSNRGHPPLWALEALTVARTPVGTLLLGRSLAEDEGRWRSRLSQAVGALEKAELGVLAEGWDGRLVIHAPSDGAVFARTSGQSASGTAAATLYEGEAVRIVVNPVAVRELGPDGLDALLLHEAVHAAVGTPRFPRAPRWLVEGLAESVTAAADRGTAAANRRLVRDRLASGSLPSALPEDADLSASAVHTLTGYALAQVAVDAVFERAGRARGLAFVRAALREPPEKWPIDQAVVTAWYLEALSEAD